LTDLTKLKELTDVNNTSNEVL